MDKIVRRHLLSWMGGAAALTVAALLVAATLSVGSVQAQEGGATYTGPIDTLTAECGGGTISFVLNADGSAVSQILLSGATVGGVDVDTLSDPPGGPFIIDVSISIDGGGFDSAFNPLEGVDAVAEGTFSGDTLSGSFGVEALACTDVGFSATKAAGDSMTLPTSGTGGPTSGSGLSFVWTLAIGALGVASLGFGAAVRRRAS